MHTAATTRSATFQQLFTLVAAFHAEFALTLEEREALFGLTAPATTKRKPTARITPALADISTLPEQERRAYYTRTAPHCDVQFMLTVGQMSAGLRADVEALASKVDASGRFTGITRSEFYRVYEALRARRRIEDDATDWTIGSCSPFDPAARILEKKAEDWQAARAIDRHNYYTPKRRNI